MGVNGVASTEDDGRACVRESARARHKQSRTADANARGLEVASRNEAAVRLYESFGFGVDGIRKGYYRDGDDALLMSLRIGGGGGGGGEEEAEEEEEPRRRRSSGGEGDSAPSSPPTPPG